MKKYVIPALSILLALSLIANVVIYTRFTTLRPIVTVGASSISKREYLAVLDATAGKQVLQKLVFAELVRQAAAKEGVTPTPADIDTRIKLIQQKQPAMAQSEPIWQLRADVATALSLENLRIKNISVSPQEVDQFYAAHRALFQQPGHVQIAMVVSQNQTDAATAQRLLAQGYTVANIAKQPNFKIPGMNGYTVTLTDPAHQPLVRKLLAIPPGQTKTFPFDNGQFLTAKVFSTVRPGYAPLGTVRGDVERLVKLQKAVPANIEIARLYKANPPVFDMDIYKADFTDVQQMNTQTPTAAQRAVSETANLPAAPGPGATGPG